MVAVVIDLVITFITLAAGVAAAPGLHFCEVKVAAVAVTTAGVPYREH